MGTREDKTGMPTSPPPYNESAPGPNVATVNPITITPGRTVITTMIAGPAVGPKSSSVTCPSCRQTVMTTVKSKASTRTHIFAVFLCLVFFPCVCVPYCIKSCNDSNHYCPNCSAYIGRYKN